MKKFLISTLLICGIILLLCLAFLFYEPIEAQYGSLEKDYAKASWVLKNGIQEKRAAEEIFIGSSLSFTNVDDSLLCQLLEKESFAVQNLCVPGDGRNLQYLVLKELLRSRKVNRVFLEVRNLEPRSGHFAFGNIAGIKDLLMSPAFMNLSYFSDLKNAVAIRSIALRLAMGERRLPAGVWETSRYGRHRWSRVPEKARLDSELSLFESQRTRRFLPKEYSHLEHNLSIHYIERIKQYCESFNTELILLYQPVYKDTVYHPAAFEVYRDREVWIPQKELLSSPQDIWADPYHLNPKGAEIYTRWLAERIISKRKET